MYAHREVYRAGQLPNEWLEEFAASTPPPASKQFDCDLVPVGPVGVTDKGSGRLPPRTDGKLNTR
jgi:hypothetical protein